jgi:hypothetical protein
MIPPIVLARRHVDDAADRIALGFILRTAAPGISVPVRSLGPPISIDTRQAVRRSRFARRR